MEVIPYEQCKVPDICTRICREDEVFILRVGRHYENKRGEWSFWVHDAKSGAELLVVHMFSVVDLARRLDEVLGLTPEEGGSHRVPELVYEVRREAGMPDHWRLEGVGWRRRSESVAGRGVIMTSSELQRLRSIVEHMVGMVAVVPDPRLGAGNELARGQRRSAKDLVATPTPRFAGKDLMTAWGISRKQTEDEA